MTQARVELSARTAADALAGTNSQETTRIAAKKLRYFAGGEWKDSTTATWMDCFDPSTGAVIAQAPQCTVAEVNEAVAAAVAAYPAWAAFRRPSGCRSSSG